MGIYSRSTWFSAFTMDCFSWIPFQICFLAKFLPYPVSMASPVDSKAHLVRPVGGQRDIHAEPWLGPAGGWAPLSFWLQFKFMVCIFSLSWMNNISNSSKGLILVFCNAWCFHVMFLVPVLAFTILFFLSSNLTLVEVRITQSQRILPLVSS